MPCKDPQPLDPQRYGIWNAYMIPLMDHCSTHYLEITAGPDSTPFSRILIRYRKAGYFEISEDGEKWQILIDDEDVRALEALLSECDVRFVKIGEIKQEIYERLLGRGPRFSRADEIIDAEADSVRILADAEVVL
jgi:hypothetical protein